MLPRQRFWHGCLCWHNNVRQVYKNHAGVEVLAFFAMNALVEALHAGWSGKVKGASSCWWKMLCRNGKMLADLSERKTIGCCIFMIGLISTNAWSVALQWRESINFSPKKNNFGAKRQSFWSFCHGRSHCWWALHAGTGGHLGQWHPNPPAKDPQTQADPRVGVKTFSWSTSTSNFNFYNGQVPRWQCAGWWCCTLCWWRRPHTVGLWQNPPACTMFWTSPYGCGEQVQTVGNAFPLCLLETYGQCTHDAGAFAKCFHFCYICRRCPTDHEVEV